MSTNSFSHVNGITIYQAKRFISFLFGPENVIKHHKSSSGFVFYIRKKALNERALKMKEKFENEFDRITIELVDTD